ncbi:hypothetical protein B0H13DRAFT_1675262, partial [Mycena leptocephala]
MLPACYQVVSYVSDYVSKLSLKSYQIFAAVYDVFEKNSEMIGGTEGEKDHARHMMRKMVNSMSSKMEIGSPMASMYLLGNPDHYASHQYVTFPWRSYVQFVRGFWYPVRKRDDGDEFHAEDEKIPIGNHNGRFVATSGVDDYRYRPLVYSNVTLYEWNQCALRKKMNEEALSDWKTDDDDDTVLAIQTSKNKNNKPVRHPFMPNHDLFLTHNVTCDFERVNTIIPNFIGGSIPRFDRGDRAYYCMTV